MSIDNPLWVDVTILVLAFLFSALSLAFTHTGKRWLHYARLAVLWVDVQFQNWAKRRRAKKEPPKPSATVQALTEMYRKVYSERAVQPKPAIDFSKISMAEDFNGDVYR